MKVLLDTNVLVSAFATRGLCADLVQVVLAEHDLVIGETVLVELRRVLGRKLESARSMIDETEEFLRREAMVASQSTSIAVELADPDDAVVLGEAIASGCDALVTGDQDLLEIADGAPIPILSPRQFWQRLRED